MTRKKTQTRKKTRPQPQTKPPTIREAMTEAIDAGWDRAQAIIHCRNKAGCTKDSAYNMWYRLTKLKKTPAVSAPKRDVKISRGDFKSMYDQDTKIREAIENGIKTLKDDFLVTDAEFRTKVCKIQHTQGWRQIALEEPYIEYQVQHKGKVHWCTPATVEWALNDVRGCTRV